MVGKLDKLIVLSLIRENFFLLSFFSFSFCRVKDLCGDFRIEWFYSVATIICIFGMCQTADEYVFSGSVKRLVEFQAFFDEFILKSFLYSEVF